MEIEIEQMDKYIEDLKSKLAFLEQLKKDHIEQQQQQEVAARNEEDLVVLKTTNDPSNPRDGALYNLLYTLHKKVTDLEAIVSKQTEVTTKRKSISPRQSNFFKDLSFRRDSLTKRDSVDIVPKETSTKSSIQQNTIPTTTVVESIIDSATSEELKCNGCSFRGDKRGEIVTHKKYCQEYWKADNTNPVYKTWATDLSNQKFQVYLLNKSTHCLYYYNNGTEVKEPFVLSLEGIRDCLIKKKKAEFIYKDTVTEIFISYISPLSRNDKLKFESEIKSLH
ncbi:hypothetical protein QLL95_gp0569 [Cotonvirus japonicus]|uniref:Uncharacterized protein n=1 Tax=Cotonvirus japonicus TaxID=2811091 RepID=A0ABM7NTR8_9VIRU|nr:hypothetical protein QLL95_gp0569 [Cotonvirus japonicus]BCS83554.1 hypothetical protein [Cotonvirus japonicus]